ncbi:MAG TPA: response regulator [Pyrinomonadaceae bacterium]|nr:response regulator [Pyrinomonadaceae bacterium]
MPSEILIADDYDDNRELLRLMLLPEGYRVREARDGRECVAEALASPPDLLLVDLSMPVLDGWGVLAALRAEASTSALPLVAVTAFASEQDRRRTLEAGFDAYLSKPFRTQELLDLVKKLLSERDGVRLAKG